jgi:predicted protein tyrosine phosphatase
MNYPFPFSEFKICGQLEAEQVVRSEPQKWNVVSICTPQSELIQNKHLFVNSNLKKAKSFCRVHFHDASSDGMGFVLCTEEDIKKVLNYSKKINNEPLLIHCAAGISRSTAIAILILIDKIKDLSETPATDAAEIVKHYRGIAIPNKYVLDLGISLLARNNEENIRWFREVYHSNLWK